MKGGVATSETNTLQAELDTPALVVDLDALDANIARIAAACRAHGVAWRPHVKSVKSPQLAKLLIDHGASGVTCATLGEAETMAAAGVGNILIANQIAGHAKLTRLTELVRATPVIVAIDSAVGATMLATSAAAAGVRLPVVIEVDLGLRRAGVQPGAGVADLARAVAGLPSLVLRGVMGWEGHATRIADAASKASVVATAVGELTASADLCRGLGFPVDIVSCGGTGTYQHAVAVPGITEIQAGGGIFGDIRCREQFHVDHRCALTVLATVTSRPNPLRIVCDSGRKAMSADYAQPLPVGLGPVASVTLSAEHGIVELLEPSCAPRVGDPLQFAVGYADTTVYLHDQIVGVRGGRVERVFPLPATRRA